ncbi:hypothetical protein ACFL4L_05185 [bacterium]
MNKFKYILIRVIAVGLLVSLSLVVYHSQRYLDCQREVRFADRIPIFLPNSKILKALSMGHYASLSDYLWIHSVIYFGRRSVDHDNIYYLHDLFEGDTDIVNRFQERHLHTHSHNHEENEQSESYEHDHLVYQEKQNQFKEKWSALQEGKPALPDSIPFLDSRVIPRIFEFPSYGMMNYLFPLIDRVTILNPYFKTPYLFSSIAVLSATGEIDWALRLLKRGYQFNPRDWEFPFYLGYINWIYKGDSQTMIDYLKEAIEKPGCPKYIDGLLIGFSNNMNQDEITRLTLQGMLESTKNPEIQERIHDLLVRLESK